MEFKIDVIKRNVVCPVELALRVLGGKWRGSILYQLKDGPLRFNELKNKVQDAVVYYNDEDDHFLTGKVLTEHLTVLLEIELIKKCLTTDNNDQYFTYCLTDKGESGIPLLLDLFYWGKNNL